MLKSLRKSLKQYKEYLLKKECFNQFEEYLAKKIFLPSLHIIKQNNIQEYKNKFNLSVLVETGTFMGDMVEAQKRSFTTIYSVELSFDLYHKAIDRFKNDKNINILQGDSALILKTILRDLNEPALFWLDGHYSEGVTAKSDKNTPILSELEQILTHMDSHVILVDDARLFTGEDDYPSIPELCEFVLSINSNKKIVIADDIIRITPN